MKPVMCSPVSSTELEENFCSGVKSWWHKYLSAPCDSMHIYGAPLHRYRLHVDYKVLPFLSSRLCNWDLCSSCYKCIHVLHLWYAEKYCSSRMWSFSAGRFQRYFGSMYLRVFMSGKGVRQSTREEVRQFRCLTLPSSQGVDLTAHNRGDILDAAAGHMYCTLYYRSAANTRTPNATRCASSN